MALSSLTPSAGGTFPSGAFDFRWAIKSSPGILGHTPRADQVLLRGSRDHQCRALHLQFAAGGLAQSAGLVLMRPGHSTASADQVSDARGSLDASLRPGSRWTLAARTPSISISVYVDGWAMCRSRRGVGIR